MKPLRVGVIGASPLRPGWAVSAHLPAIRALSELELTAVATSNEVSARAAAMEYNVEAYSSADELITRKDIDLVVITVRLSEHFRMAELALRSGKHVVCEWPLAATTREAVSLSRIAQQSEAHSLVGLQATMAPSIRYARDLVESGALGDILGTTLTGSGIGWGQTSDSRHAYMYDRNSRVSVLSVPLMHALDAMTFVLGDFIDLKAVAATRHAKIDLTDTGETLRPTAPDHVAVAATFKNGAPASIFYRGGTSRADNFRWEINGSLGDLVFTSPVGNLQVLSPVLFWGRDDSMAMTKLRIPPDFDLNIPVPSGPAGNVTRLYAAFINDLKFGARGRTAPDFSHAVRIHKLLDVIEASSMSGADKPAHLVQGDFL